jgi:hypothetical protein
MYCFCACGHFRSAFHELGNRRAILQLKLQFRRSATPTFDFAEAFDVLVISVSPFKEYLCQLQCLNLSSKLFDFICSQSGQQFFE